MQFSPYNETNIFEITPEEKKNLSLYKTSKIVNYLEWCQDRQKS